MITVSTLKGEQTASVQQFVWKAIRNPNTLMGHLASFRDYYVETSDMYRILVQKPIGKRALEKPKRRWEY
jgi:hypothetical protein